MNRRNFLKNIGIGAGVVAVAPTVLTDTEIIHISVDTNYMSLTQICEPYWNDGKVKALMEFTLKNFRKDFERTIFYGTKW